MTIWYEELPNSSFAAVLHRVAKEEDVSLFALAEKLGISSPRLGVLLSKEPIGSLTESEVEAVAKFTGLPGVKIRAIVASSDQLLGEMKEAFGHRLGEKSQKGHVGGTLSDDVGNR